MPSVALASIPLQLVCQLIVQGTPVAVNTTLAQPIPPQVASRVGPLPEGYVAYPDINVAYRVHDEVVTWKQARQLCMDEGAQLAQIDTMKKFQYVTRQRHSTKATHVGIIRMFDDADWVSVSTGRTLTDLPWAPDEPNTSWDCVMIKFDEGGLGNYDCVRQGDFVCELPIPN